MQIKKDYYTITKSIKLKLTANDWELYTSMTGADKTASQMNKEISKILNRPGISYSEASIESYEVLEKFFEFGAEDTEPRAVLQMILRDYFGVQNA